MSLIRSTIQTAIVAALNGAGKPSGIPSAAVARGRQATANTILVYRVDDPAERMGGPRGPAYRRRLRFRVECRATTAATGDPYSNVDALEAWVVKAVGGLLIPGTLHEVTLDTTDYTEEAADRAYVRADVFVVVSYQHRSDDLEQWG